MSEFSSRSYAAIIHRRSTIIDLSISSVDRLSPPLPGHPAVRPGTLLTFIVVDVIVAVAFQLGVTVQTVPSVGALALPHVVAVHPALAVARTAVRTAFQRAVFAVPAGHAQARAVLALTVLVAPVVAQLRVAVLTRPAGVTDASVAHAMAVRAAVQIAELCETKHDNYTSECHAANLFSPRPTNITLPDLINTLD